MTEVPTQKLVVPVIEAATGSTVTMVVTVPQVLMKLIVVVAMTDAAPAAAAEKAPEVEPMVPTLVTELLQVPVPPLIVNDKLPPSQTALVLPEIVVGVTLTVATMELFDAVQPVASSVTVRLYVPALLVVTEVIDGF